MGRERGEGERRELSGAEWARYQGDPVGFVREVLGQELWSRQAEILAAVRDQPQVTVRSGHGVGKTFVAACAALWWAYCFRPSLVLTTAPTARQVEALLWGEIGRLFRRAKQPLSGRCLATRLSVSEDQEGVGLSTNEPERFAGWHREHLLAIVDEASGVEEAIYETLLGVLTSRHSHLLLIGNPTKPSGTFFESHRREGWEKLKIAATDSPNFRGEGSGDRGQGDGDAGAVPDPSPLTPVPCAFGIDVARFGSCETVVAVRRGERLEAVEAWSGQDLMATCGRVAAMIREWRPGTVVVDPVGLGAGLLDRLRERQREGGLPALALVEENGGARASDAEQFANRRAELFHGLRERYRAGAIAHARRFPRLAAQLTALKYRFTSRGQWLVESKEELRARGLPSPDHADAVALCFAPARASALRLPVIRVGTRPVQLPLPRL
jgi:phage terminase large subunit